MLLLRPGMRRWMLSLVGNLVAGSATEQITGACSSNSEFEDVLDLPAYPALGEIPGTVQHGSSCFAHFSPFSFA